MTDIYLYLSALHTSVAPSQSMVNHEYPKHGTCELVMPHFFAVTQRPGHEPWPGGIGIMLGHSGMKMVTHVVWDVVF